MKRAILALAVGCGLWTAAALAQETGPTEPLSGEPGDPRDDSQLANANSAFQLGISMFDAGDPEAAADLFAEALRGRRQALGDRHPETLESLKAYAAALLRSGRPEAALAPFAEDLEARQAVYGTAHPGTLQSMNNYGFALLEANRLEQAAATFKNAWELSEQALGADDRATLQRQANYAIVLNRLGRPKDADPLYQDIVAKSRELLGVSHPSTIRYLTNHGLIARNLGRLKEAASLLEEARWGANIVHGPNHPATLRIVAAYGNLTSEMGYTADAVPMLERAYQGLVGQLGARHRETLDAQNNLALALDRAGRLSEAREMMEQNHRLSAEVLGEDQRSTILRLGNLAALETRVGRVEAAERKFAKVLDSFRRVLGERHPETHNALANYASALAALGRNQDALPIYAEVYALSQELLGESHPDTLNRMGNYAFALERVGRSEDSLALAQQTLELRRSTLGEQHRLTLSSRYNVAAQLLKLERHSEALPQFKQAYATALEQYGLENPDTLQLLAGYARVLSVLERHDEAAPLWQTVLEANDRAYGEAHPESLEKNRAYVDSQLRAGAFDLALPIARKNARLLRARAGELGSLGLQGFAQRARETGDRQFDERLLSDVLWSNFEGNGAIATEAFSALQLASAGSASRAVTEAAAARFAFSQGLEDLVEERQALAREWPAIESELVANQLGGEAMAAARTTLQDRLDAIERRIAEIDARLEQDAPQYFAILNQQAVALEELRASLGEDEAVLMLVPTARGTHAMVVSDHGIRWSRSDWDQDEVAAKVAELRQGMEVSAAARLPRFDFALAHEVYAELIAPVEPALAGMSRVYVVADGALSRLPLGALVTEPLVANHASEPEDGGESGSEPAAAVRATLFGGGSTGSIRANDPADFRKAAWLADRYPLVNLPSLQSLVFIRTFGLQDSELEGSGYTGFGDPILSGHSSLASRGTNANGAVDAASLLSRSAGDGGLMDAAALRDLSSLPGTKQELEQVSRMLGATQASLYLGDAMTEPAIRTADLSQTRILHLATHGLTSEEGGRLGNLAEPGLVFTPPERSEAGNDGYLAASEVVGLNLTLAEWVILSACNTAAPSGKPGETGLSGLAQAFFYAGAESLLVSHWPVFDTVAPVLTAETLIRAQAGLSRAEAFQAAMREVRKTNPHPAVWAPFVLVGEGR